MVQMNLTVYAQGILKRSSKVGLFERLLLPGLRAHPVSVSSPRPTGVLPQMQSLAGELYGRESREPTPERIVLEAYPCQELLEVLSCRSGKDIFQLQKVPEGKKVG